MKFTDPATKPFTKVTVWGEAPSTNAVRWLSIAQQMQAARKILSTAHFSCIFLGRKQVVGTFYNNFSSFNIDVYG